MAAINNPLRGNAKLVVLGEADPDSDYTPPSGTMVERLDCAQYMLQDIIEGVLDDMRCGDWSRVSGDMK